MWKIVWMIVTVAASYAVAVAGMYIFLQYRLSVLKRWQATREAEVRDSDAYKSLPSDYQYALNGHILRELKEEEKLRDVFHACRNTLLIIGGVAPLMAILAKSQEVNEVLSVIASISSFLMGVFSVDRFATEHRRAGYLIDRRLMEWLAGVGGDTPKDRFQTLMSRVSEILDTGETSFIGAGQNGNAAPIAPPEAFPITPEYSSIPNPPPPPPMISEPTPQPAAKPSVTHIVTPQPTPPLMPEQNTEHELDEIIDEWGGMGEIEITQGGTTIVAKEDFANWQAQELGQK